MSTLSVIIIIVASLGALVCYAFAVQTIQQKREKRRRLLAALKARARTFKFMLNGFPDGFLTKELTMLVQRSLADICEQLSKLEPSDPAHLQDLQFISQQMMESKRNIKPSKPARLESQQQIKDVKVGLEELYNFVERLSQSRTLPKSHTDLYRGQIKHLSVLASVDSYSIHGKQANQAGKIKLAIHYFDLALRLLLRENKPSVYESRIQEMRSIVAELQERIQQEDPEKLLSRQELAEQEEVKEEWNKFADKDSIWKKKNIYD